MSPLCSLDSTALGWLVFWLGVLACGAWLALLGTVHAVLTNDERLKTKQHEKTKDVELAIERMKVIGTDRGAP